MATAWSQWMRAAFVFTVVLGSIPAAVAQSPSVLKDVRFWSSRGVTRVALETTGEARFEYNRLRNPDRVYVDLFDVKPKEDFRGLSYTVPVNDGTVKQIRVAPNRAGVTRVVLDLDGPVEIHANQLTNPDRVVLEVRQVGVIGDGPVETAEVGVLPPVIRPATAKPYRPPPVFPVPAGKPLFDETARLPESGVPRGAAGLPEHRVRDIARGTVVKPPAPAPPPPPAPKVLAEAAVPAIVGNERALEPAPAEPNRRGNQSLTRALGLKLNRVVIDAGHGGKDQGTATRSGLLEKELVLDVALRLGRLLERGGIEVIYTRSKDVFIPLEKRTEIANNSKADLFLSIHANASSLRTVAGVETYYLSLASTPVEMDLAARENAASEKSIHELGDLVRQIAQNDALEESKDFAAKIQSASHELSVKSHGRLKNRGVKKAPLVVLIGASMPAVLTEIGFISNPREESLLKKGDHRQRIAEALEKGILEYGKTLSHFRVARRAAE
ncbi:MAG: N-acetylmuramoyl-L-alanine amidase [Bryobacteraceae bacterium]